MAIAGIIGIAANSAPAYAENPGELLQRSLAKLAAPELKIAYALHPGICTIGWPKDQKWTIECKGVPIHFYRQISLCDPGPPKACGPMPSTYTDCRSFSWSVDASGEPEDLFGDRHHPFSSIQDDCRPKGTLASDRTEMNRRGIALLPEEILDYAGQYTGKPRPLK
jgi:hypothetical protein